MLGCGLAAYCCTHSISYLMNLRGGVPFSLSIFTLMLWVGLFLLLWYLRPEREEKLSGHRAWFTAIWSLVFGVLLVAGYQLQWQGYTDPGVLGKGKLVVRGLFLAMAVFPLGYRGITRLEKWLDSRSESVPGGGKKWKNGAVYAGCLSGILLCWIPVWLAYYPVIMSYDFHKQSLEALLGPQYFNNHHPLAHTWLIYVFRNLGGAIGSYETGFALFCLFQQLITAAVLGYACVMIYRMTGKKWAVVVSALFFGCFPLISVFVMCTTKDVLFGDFFLLFLILWMEKLYFPGTGRSRLAVDMGLLLSGVLMMLFRNNALYAVLVFGILYLFLGKRGERWKVFGLIMALLLCGKGALAGLQNGFHAHKGSEIEKYSVAYQSMARVGNRQSGNLSAEDYALLDQYVTESCWADYNPPLADTIKAAVQKVNFNEKKSWDDMGQVLGAWVKIGLHYPNEYIDAFLDLTRGYWFLDDTSHAEMLGVGAQERMGLLYTYNSAAEESLPGMQHISRFPWLEEKLEELLSENSYTRYPVVSNFFKPAFWCWLSVTAMLWFWYRKERRGMTVLLYPMAYFGTMLLGPTAIIRYVYPFILLAPLILAMVFAQNEQ